MEDNRTRAIVEIYGEEYIVRGDSPPDYIAMIARYVDKKMKQIGNRNSQLSVSKIAVLTALNIADELSKLQEDYDNLVKLMDNEKRPAKEKTRSTK